MATVKNLWDILRGRFPENEYALMGEVEAGSRFIDYVAFNLWGSRGLAIHGIEAARISASSSWNAL